MRILYVSQYFPPEMGAPAARVSEIARRWVERGHHVTVLTAFPNHPTGIIPPTYPQHVFLREWWGKVRVVRTYIYPTPNAGFLKRTLNYLSFMASSVLLGGPSTGAFDVVVATSPQLFVAAAGFALSRWKRAPYVLEIRDLWPQSIVELGQLRSPSWIRRLEALESFLYRRADRIVVVARTFADHIERRGIDPEKIQYVPNGVDLSRFSPRTPDPRLRMHLGIDGAFTVAYIGTHGLSHNLETALACARRISEEGRFHFLFVGEGARRADLEAMARAMGLRNVTFVGEVSRARVADYYALADVVLVPLRDLPVFRTVIPSKMFEVFGMAKPVVLAVDGEARRIVEESGGGVFCPPEDPDALRRTLLSLYAQPDRVEEMGRRGRAFVEESFDRDRLADLYAELLEQVVGVPAPVPAQEEVLSSR